MNKIIISAIAFFIICGSAEAQLVRFKIDTVKATKGIKIKTIDRTSFFDMLDLSNQTTTPSIGDSTITKPKLSTTVNVLLHQSGSGIAYPPDDVGIEFKITGPDTSVGVKDSYIGTITQDFIAFPVDTLALQQLNMDESRVAYMRGLDATNNPDKGGGWFTVVDSSDYGSMLTTATKSAEWFEHLTTDRVWMRDIYRIRGVGHLNDFGVMGDNSNDDTEEVRAAFESGIPLEGTGGDSCKITSTIRITDIPVYFTSNNGQHVNFVSSINDTVFLFDETYPTYGAVNDTTDSLQKDVIQGLNFYVVHNPSEFDVGDLIKLVSTKIFYHQAGAANRKGEMNKVQLISGDTLWTTRAAADHYSIENAVETVYILTIKDPQPLYIQDMNFVKTSALEDTVPAVMFEFKDRPHVYRCKTDSAMYVGIQFRDCLDFTIDFCESYYSNKSGAGYAINAKGCTGGVIERCFLYNSRHHIEVSASTIPSREVIVRNNMVTGGGNFSTHSGSENTTFLNNHIGGLASNTNQQDAFYIRGEDVKIINNTMYSGGNSLVLAGSAPNLQVIGNTITSAIQWDVDTVQYAGATRYKEQGNSRWLVMYQLGGTGTEWHDDLKRNSIIIKNNTLLHINASNDAFAGIFYSAGFDTLWNLEISGNTIGAERSTEADNNTWVIYSADATVYNRARIQDNNLIDIKGEGWKEKAGGGWQYFSDSTYFDSSYYEIIDDNGDIMINDVWTYIKNAEMDSLDVYYLPAGVLGSGVARIDTAGTGYQFEGKAEFRFTNIGQVTLEDTTGFSDIFSTSDTGGKFCIFDNGTHVGLKNNIGDDRKVRIKVEYYRP